VVCGMNKKTFMGNWQVPKTSEQQFKSFSGTLTLFENGNINLDFTIDDTELELLHPKLVNNLHQINNQAPIPLISGRAKDLESNTISDFSLFDLDIINYSGPGLLHVTLQAKYSITGLRFQKFDNLKFQLSMMKFEGIDIWLDKYGFNINRHDDTLPFKTTIVFTQPEPIEIIKSDIEQVYFYFRATSPASVNSNKVTIDQSIFINWECHEPKAFNELICVSERLQNFFSFISSYPSRRIKHQIRILKGEYNQKTHLGYKNLEFNYSDRTIEFNDHAKKSDFLFTYSTYGEKCKEILANWLSTYATHTLALDQYFDMKYSKNIHLTSRLITLTSVLEIFYINKFKKDPSLKIKLNYLVAGKEKLFDVLPIAKNDMITHIADVRRYYVHGNKSKIFKEEHIHEGALNRFCMQLENIFKIYILSEIGISDEEILKIINRQPWRWGVNDN
jgi:hypothetical protein